MFNKLPISFFGSDYAAASGLVTFGTASLTSGTLAGSFDPSATVSNLITTAADHHLKPGDPVKFSGSAATGITLGSVYYVLAAPTARTLTISSTLGGAVVTLSAGSAGTTDISVLGCLFDVTDSEAEPATTGDWRKFISGFMAMIYSRWSNTAVADRPAKISITRSTGVDPATLEVIINYTVRVVNAAAPLEVADE